MKNQPNPFFSLASLLLATLLTGGMTSLAETPQQTPPVAPTMTTFLGPKDFKGSWQPRRSDANTGGQSTYHGRVVFTNIARNIVEGVLPKDLRLAENRSPTPGLHPVVYLYGHQAKTTYVVKGQEIQIDTPYQELILLIPFVQLVDHEKWHNYVVRMYLNNRVARDIGNAYYGYAKRKATFEENFTEFTVLVGGRPAPAFQATVETLGPWQTSKDAEGTLPHYRDIQTIFEMPVVGMHEVSGNPVCSYFEWKYDATEVAPVRSQHRFLRPFTRDMESWPTLGSLISVADGAIAIQKLQWRLKFPPDYSCEF